MTAVAFAARAAAGPEPGHLTGLRRVRGMEEGHVERLAEAGTRLPDQEAEVRRDFTREVEGPYPGS